MSSLADLDAEQVAVAVDVWRARMREHYAAGAAYVHVIVNERREGGASLPHTHAQVYALDFVPAAIARERERWGAYATRTMGSDLLEDLVQEEVKLGDRIVAIDDEAVLMAPYGGRLPYQLMLAPRTPRPRFEDDGPTGAALLHDALRRLGRRLGHQPPLNLWVRSAPAGTDRFCWRIDIVPRLTHLAGLELGAGRAPEHRRARAGRRGAARRLMRALVQRVARAAVRVDGDDRRRDRARAAGPARGDARRHAGHGRPPGRQGARAARLRRRRRPHERRARASARCSSSASSRCTATRAAATARPTSTPRGPSTPSRCTSASRDRLGAARGVFGALMEVELVNDGPVTLLLELGAA